MSWIAVAVAGGAVVGAGAGIYGANKQAESADDALNAQQAQNKDNQEFIQRQGDISKQDMMPLYTKAQEDRTSGTNHALALNGQSMMSQIDTTGDASVRAQNSILAGNQQAQNAILGLPVNNNALQSYRLTPQDGLTGLFDAQLPGGLGMPEDFTPTLSGKPENLSGFVEPGMTNAQLVAKAHSDGIISKKDYKILQKHFENSGTGDGMYWASTGNAGELINNLNSQGKLDNGFRSTMENFFNLLYPDG